MSYILLCDIHHQKWFPTTFIDLDTITGLPDLASKSNNCKINFRHDQTNNGKHFILIMVPFSDSGELLCWKDF